MIQVTIGRLILALWLTGYHLLHIEAFQQHISTNFGITNPTTMPTSPSTHWRHREKSLVPYPSIKLQMQSAPINLNNDEKGKVSISDDDKAELAKNEKKYRNKIKAASAVTALLGGGAGLVICSGAGAWRYYLAGGICAAISHSVATPVDVIKTRKQVDESLKDMSMLKSGIKIMKDDGGPKALLAGLGPTTVGYLLEGAIKFGIYEVSKPLVGSMLAWSAALCRLSWINSKILGFIISGGIAGVAASIMLCPMEALRIRLVAEPEMGSNGWIDGGLKMVGNEGVKGFYKSLLAMLTKQVPYTITKNVSFDFITTIAYTTIATRGITICSKWKLAIPLLSAMLASVLSCISSQPGDMLLSVVNAHRGKKATVDFFNEIMEKEGIVGFFVGIQERFLHVGMIVTLQLLIYDYVKRLVGIAATGL